MAFEGHIWCWHIYDKRMVNSLLHFDVFGVISAVMRNVHVDCSSSALRHICAGGSHIYSEPYDSMVNCSLQSIYMVIVFASNFICGMNIV